MVATAAADLKGWPLTWHPKLGQIAHKPYAQMLRAFLAQTTAAHTVYPRQQDIFKAFELTPFAAVKVVILGQDPYHQPGQAHGLAFSVPTSQKIPPSLQNIYKELLSDCQITPPQHGCLTQWAAQGVLLLNSVLTVTRAQPAAHQNQGWERFTDEVIQLLNQEREQLVFLLWGSYAQKKGHWIDPKRHCVLKAPHPSPLSAHRGFLGCRHFSKANAYLEQTDQTPICWEIT